MAPIECSPHPNVEISPSRRRPKKGARERAAWRAVERGQRATIKTPKKAYAKVRPAFAVNPPRCALPGKSTSALDRMTAPPNATVAGGGAPRGENAATRTGVRAAGAA